MCLSSCTPAAGAEKLVEKRGGAGAPRYWPFDAGCCIDMLWKGSYIEEVILVARARRDVGRDSLIAKFSQVCRVTEDGRIDAEGGAFS